MLRLLEEEENRSRMQEINKLCPVLDELEFRVSLKNLTLMSYASLAAILCVVRQQQLRLLLLATVV